jgi:hypothetical protein
MSDPQIRQIGQIQEAHAKALRSQGAKEQKKIFPILPLRLRPFAPLREPLIQ